MVNQIDWYNGFLAGMVSAMTTKSRFVTGHNIGDVLTDYDMTPIYKFGQEIWNIGPPNATGNWGHCAIDSKDGIYFTSTDSNTQPLTKYDTSGHQIWCIDYSDSYGYGQEIIIDKLDNIYVNFGNGGVTKLNTSGAIISKLSYMPKAIDNSGNMYELNIINNPNYSLIKHNNIGTTLWEVSIPNMLSNYGSITIDNNNDIWIPYNSYDIGSISFQKLSGMDGSVICSHLYESNMEGMVIDSLNNLYVITMNNQVEKFNSSGISQWIYYNIYNPLTISKDSNNNIYIFCKSWYSGDPFMIELNTNGEILQRGGNGGLLIDSNGFSNSVVDSNGDCYLTYYSVKSLRKLHGSSSYEIIN